MSNADTERYAELVKEWQAVHQKAVAAQAKITAVMAEHTQITRKVLPNEWLDVADKLWEEEETLRKAMHDFCMKALDV